jgi:hypothetical protein
VSISSRAARRNSERSRAIRHAELRFIAEKTPRNTLEAIGGVMTFSAHIAPKAARRKPMWEPYRRTFRSMQALMVVVTLIVMSWTRSVPFTAALFVMMQVGAVLGAMWGHQLKQRIRRPDEPSARRG